MSLVLDVLPNDRQRCTFVAKTKCTCSAKTHGLPLRMALSVVDGTVGGVLARYRYRAHQGRCAPGRGEDRRRRGATPGDHPGEDHPGTGMARRGRLGRPCLLYTSDAAD